METGAGRVDWNSPAGQRLKALVEVLALPSNWREPDFVAVRDTYQTARRLRKNPRSQLLPDALNYEAVYMGK